jgi:sigma-B regulation protein RsbU (phosphoserine phosphatase)
MKKIPSVINNLLSSRRGEKELRTTLDSLAEGVIITDEHGKFLFFNQVAQKILGIGLRHVSPAEWSSVYGCYYPDKITPYPAEQLPLAQAIRGNRVTSELIFIRNPERPQGTYIDISANPLRGPDGSVRGGTVIFRDVTQTRQNEERLRKLSSAVEQTADSVVITNNQGVIEYVNPAFEKTTGYSCEEVLGKTPRILKSGVHDGSFYKKLWRKILNGNPYRGTIVNRKKGGELYWSEQTITPIKDKNGNITNFVTVMKDITELKEKHEQDARLKVAREIQQRLLKPDISVPGFDIAGATYPAVETTGDYFDFVPFSDGCIGIVVGDALGHGIGAALIMAQTRAYLRAFARTESDPGVILNLLNQELARDLGDDHFVTLILARLDPRRNMLDYASAGHVPAYLLNSAGRVDHVMESIDIPLGINRDWTFRKSEPIKLAPENVLVFFSDGIMELFLRGKIEFWVDRALDIIAHHRLGSSHQILENLYQEARDFLEGQPQVDDMTCIICKVGCSQGLPSGEGSELEQISRDNAGL